MTDRDALLAAALDTPADDTARLILGDYLQDHDEPDFGRFIWAGVTASRFRDHDVIDDPDYYRALGEIAAVAAAPARWLAALGLVRSPLSAREWAWDHVVDRVTVRVGSVVGVFERGLLTELAVALEEWYAAAPGALAAWPVARATVADVPGLSFAVLPPGARRPKWELAASVQVPGRRVRLTGGVLAASLAPSAFLTEDAGGWTVKEEFQTREDLTAAITAASARLVAELREVAADRWPTPRR
ncbi:MAG: hypothetical protein JWO38_1582 [Gemmataceae bacterium]|nr:hypothetical protein [Gemmataceae bacterium]